MSILALRQEIASLEKEMATDLYTLNEEARIAISNRTEKVDRLLRQGIVQLYWMYAKGNRDAGNRERETKPFIETKNTMDALKVKMTAIQIYVKV